MARPHDGRLGMATGCAFGGRMRGVELRLRLTSHPMHRGGRLFRGVSTRDDRYGSVRARTGYGYPKKRSLSTHASDRRDTGDAKSSAAGARVSEANAEGEVDRIAESVERGASHSRPLCRVGRDLWWRAVG
jgi:hypothetical protein